MSDAIPSHGTLVQLGDGQGAYTTIAELGDVGLPDFGNDTEEVTCQTTPGRERAFVSTLHKEKTVDFPISWVPSDATHDSATGLKAAADDGVARPFRIVLPDPEQTTFSFDAIVEGFKPTGAVAGVLKADLTLKVTDDVEETTGSGS